jgi:hypothetical protein
MWEHLKLRYGTIAGTAGGTLLSMLSYIGDEVIKTAFLAAIGAAVSFTVSFCLQRFVKRWRK